MKKIYNICLVLFLLFAGQQVLAQRIGDLKGIHFQAVAIDDNGKEIVGMDINGKPVYNRTIGVRFSILKGNNGPVQYQETHSTLTDAHGLFSLVIGSGKHTEGVTKLMDIPWIDADQFLKVEISLKNDGNYKMVSLQQFMAVPYSFYTDDIADDAITTAKILNEEILSEDIKNETILAEDIKEGAVETSEILNETILAEDIAEGAVTSSEILDETIVAADIAEGAVTTSEILDETILAEDIAEGAVTTSEILDETIVAADIAEGAVTTSEILNGTIINEDIAADAITTDKIQDGTIINEDIAADAVTTDKILDGTIVNADIANGTVDLTAKVTNVLPVANGGTGVDGSVAADGQILIGNGTNNNFNLANLTAGSGIRINNTPGGIEIISTVTGIDQAVSEGSFAPGTVGDGDSKESGTIPVTNAALGDLVIASLPIDLQGCQLTAYVSEAGKVKLVLSNLTGSDKTFSPSKPKILVIK